MENDKIELNECNLQRRLRHRAYNIKKQHQRRYCLEGWLKDFLPIVRDLEKVKAIDKKYEKMLMLNIKNQNNGNNKY